MQSPEMTLNEAKSRLREVLKTGARCPCCNQWVQMYSYSFHAGMAKVLMFIVHAYDRGDVGKDEFFHVEHYLKEKKVRFHGYHSKLKFWGMLEQKENTDDPKKKWSGYWRVTQKGRDFVEGKLEVPKCAKLYNQKCYGFEGDLVAIKDTIKDYFDYERMLSLANYEALDCNDK